MRELKEYPEFPCYMRIKRVDVFEKGIVIANIGGEFPFLCVKWGEEQAYLKGDDFVTMAKHNYSIEPPTKDNYVPFTRKDIDSFCNKWVRAHMCESPDYPIQEIDLTTITINGAKISYKDALWVYEFVDGTRFGKKVE
jgi:hypothetical protein